MLRHQNHAIIEGPSFLVSMLSVRDGCNELKKPTVTSSERKLHKYFTETSSLPRHFTHISIGVPVSVCFESRYLPTPKTNMTMEHPPFESMYFLLNMGDFPVCQVSFQGVVRGIFIHCRGFFAVQNLSTGHGLGHHLSPAGGIQRWFFGSQWRWQGWQGWRYTPEVYTLED